MLKREHIRDTLDHIVDGLFSQTAEDEKLLSGDISPEQTIKVCNCLDQLAEIFVQWAEQNTPTRKYVVHVVRDYKFHGNAEVEAGSVQEAEETALKLVNDLLVVNAITSGGTDLRGMELIENGSCYVETVEIVEER